MQSRGRGAQRRDRAAGSAPTAAVRPEAGLPCDARACGLPHNSLRSLRSLRSDRCGKSEVDARASRARPQALRFSAPQSRCACCPVTPLRSGAGPCASAAVLLAKPRAGVWRSDSAAPRSAGSGASARSAPPPQTCGICLSAVNEVNVASYAAGPGTEHRRAVGPPGRPPQSERSQAPARGFAGSDSGHAQSPRDPRDRALPPAFSEAPPQRRAATMTALTGAAP